MPLQNLDAKSGYFLFYTGVSSNVMVIFVWKKLVSTLDTRRTILHLFIKICRYVYRD